MMKRLMCLAALAALASAVPTTLAAQYQQGDPIYTTYYYSDASHSEVVGTSHGTCTWWGPGDYHEGGYSSYSEQVLVGYCYRGNWQPI
jgi:hypothetical protein